MRPGRRLRKASEYYWIHPELKKQLSTACWNEIGINRHCLHDEDDPWAGYWKYRKSIYLAETVLRSIGDKTIEEMED